MSKEKHISFGDVLEIVPVAFPGPVDSIDDLHRLATRLAVSLQDDKGTCPSYFLINMTGLPVVMLEAKWTNNEEKDAVVHFIRGIIAKGGAGHPVESYAFIGEAYALRATNEPGKPYNRADHPQSLADDPDHYEILMSYAFDRDGGERATVYEFEPGKPETRKPADYSGDADGWTMSGRLWNLFRTTH